MVLESLAKVSLQSVLHGAGWSGDIEINISTRPERWLLPTRGRSNKVSLVLYIAIYLIDGDSVKEAGSFNGARLKSEERRKRGPYA